MMMTSIATRKIVLPALLFSALLTAGCKQAEGEGRGQGEARPTALALDSGGAQRVADQAQGDDEHAHGEHAHGPDEHPADAHAGRAHGAEEHAADAHGEDDHAHGRETPRLRLSDEQLTEFGIELRPAEAGALSVAQPLAGEVVFDPDRLAHVTARVHGVVQAVLKRTGEEVQRGDVLAVLTSRALAQSKSEYLSAQARLDLVEATYARKRRLAEQQITSEAELLESRQAWREARVRLQLAERELQALGLSSRQITGLPKEGAAELARYELTAPLDGTVIDRQLTTGETVGPETEAPPFVIADTERVWAQLTVYPRNLADVQAGRAVRVMADDTGASATATIDYVSPQLDEATRAATARVVLDNEDSRWRPGQFVTARIQVEQAQGKVVVPESAIQKVDGQAVVFVLGNEGLEPRPVQIGSRANGRWRFAQAFSRKNAMRRPTPSCSRPSSVAKPWSTRATCIERAGEHPRGLFRHRI